METGKNILQKRYTKWVAGAVAVGILAAGIYFPTNCGNNQIKQKPTVQTIKISPESTPKTDYSQINQGLDKYDLLPGTGLETPKTEFKKGIEEKLKGLYVESQVEVAKAEKPKYKGLVDFLESNKIKTDQETRENIFYGLGMDGKYKSKDNAEQNLEMLKQLKGKTPDELKALADYEHPELSYAQKKVQEIRENKLKQLTQPKVIPEYGQVIPGEIVNEEGMNIKSKYASPKSLEKIIVEPEVTAEKDSQFMTYVKEQAATTAVGVKTEKDIFGESKYDRTKIGDRMNEDLSNTGINILNGLYGLKGAIEGILDLPGDIVNGFSWGLIPTYEITNGKVKLTDSKPEGSIVGKILHPIKQIIGEGLFGDIVNPTLDTAQGVTFAAVNLAQMPFSATLGCTEPTRYVTDGLFSTAYIGADAIFQNFPGGDASTRVHSTDLREGWKGIPFVKNCYTNEYEADLAGINENIQKDKIIIENTTFRKHLETPASIAGDALLLWLINECCDKGSDHPSPKSTPKGIGGNRIGGGALR